VALLETEGGEFGSGRAGKFGDGLLTLTGEVGSGRGELAIELSEFSVDLVEGRLAGFKCLELRSGVSCRVEDIGQGGAILTFECLDQIKAFFELSELIGIEVDPIGVVFEVASQVLEECGSLLVSGQEGGGGGVESMEFGEGPAEEGGQREGGLVLAGEVVERGLGQFQQARGVGGAGVILGELEVIFRGEAG
jgi:hypothetical protein